MPENRPDPYLGTDDESEVFGNVPEYLNRYRCPKCGATWSDVWTAACDDECGACGTRNISPESSEALTND